MGHESAFGLHEPLSFDGLQEPMKKQRLQEHQIRAVVKRLLEGTYRDNLIAQQVVSALEFQFEGKSDTVLSWPRSLRRQCL